MLGVSAHASPGIFLMKVEKPTHRERRAEIRRPTIVSSLDQNEMIQRANGDIGRMPASGCCADLENSKKIRKLCKVDRRAYDANLFLPRFATAIRRNSASSCFRARRHNEPRQ